MRSIQLVAEALALPCFRDVLGFVGTPECSPFAYKEYPNEASACADLAAYHKKQLQLMGTKMGRGGFDVKDLHKKNDLLELSVGELCVLCII